jgi:hypothetical protein
MSVLPALAGCGKSGAGETAVEGAIQLAGQPVTNGTGTVTWVTATGLRLTTPVDPTCHYLLYNPPEGPMKIGVAMIEYMTLEQATQPGAKPPKKLVPAKYADPDQSGLTYIVGKGKQTFNIDLLP